MFTWQYAMWGMLPWLITSKRSAHLQEADKSNFICPTSILIPKVPCWFLSARTTVISSSPAPKPPRSKIGHSFWIRSFEPRTTNYRPKWRQMSWSSLRAFLTNPSVWWVQLVSAKETSRKWNHSKRLLQLIQDKSFAWPKVELRQLEIAQCPWNRATTTGKDLDRHGQQHDRKELHQEAVSEQYGLKEACFVTFLFCDHLAKSLNQSPHKQTWSVLSRSSKCLIFLILRN